MLRPECLIACIREYVEAEMGQSFVAPSSFDLGEFYDDSNCRTPLVFILSPGNTSLSSFLLEYGESHLQSVIAVSNFSGYLISKIIICIQQVLAFLLFIDSWRKIIELKRSSTIRFYLGERLCRIVENFQ